MKRGEGKGRAEEKERKGRGRGKTRGRKDQEEKEYSCILEAGARGMRAEKELNWTSLEGSLASEWVQSGFY